MALIYTNAELKEQGYLSGATIDLQEEDSENSFAISLGMEKFGMLSKGCYVFDEDNPRFGGQLQKIHIQTVNNSLVWEGSTFAGILSTKIIEPGTENPYRVIQGTFDEKINAVLQLTGLSSVFYTDIDFDDDDDDWTVDRYTDALSALRELFAKNGITMSVMFDKEAKKLKLYDSAPRTITFDSELLNFDITKDMTPVNHLICLGSGQLALRDVYHLYADQTGTISETQTIFGQNEISAVYDYSNVESYDELKKQGKKHFQELLDNVEKMEITPTEEVILNIGDTIIGEEHVSGIRVEKKVKKIIYKAHDDLPPTITYETANTKGQ